MRHQEGSCGEVFPHPGILPQCGIERLIKKRCSGEKLKKISAVAPDFEKNGPERIVQVCFFLSCHCLIRSGRETIPLGRKMMISTSSTPMMMNRP